MKTQSLTISFGLLLLVIFAWRQFNPGNAVKPAMNHADHIPGVNEQRASGLASKPSMIQPHDPNSAILQWSQIESTNYTTYIANLRKIGCPEQTIREIIHADLNALLHQRGADKRAARSKEFWRPEFGADEKQGPVISDENDREVRQMLDELLGTTTASASLLSPGRTPLEKAPSFDGPLESKRDPLTQWWEKYQELEQRLYGEIGSEGLSQDRLDRLRELQTMREKELSELLTPSELNEYEVRFSPAADAVRESLAGVEVTEQEFRALVAAEKEFDAAVGSLPEGADEHLVEDLEEKHQTALSEILTDERLGRFVGNLLNSEEEE